MVAYSLLSGLISPQVTAQLFCKIVQNNSDIGPEITHSITEADFSWKVRIYGKEVSTQSCFVLCNIQRDQTKS